MPSFDKHADNLLQAIGKEWNQDVKQDELVLAFTVGAKRTPALLQLLEVSPESSENTGETSYLDPKPCSYLDCSGIKLGTSTDSTFTSLVILNRYLEKVKYVKVLIFVPYNKLMTEAEPDTENNWSSTIFSCPAIHLLNEMPHLKKSFGLVVIQYVESKPSGKNFQEIRNAFTDQIKVIRNNLLTECASPELQLHLDFLKLIIRKDIHFLILQQQQKYHWDGTVKSLINLKAPPGNKIAKFHQHLCVPNKISGKLFLSTLKKVHEEQHFTAISSRLHNQLTTIINQLIASILNSVLRQYSLEMSAQPKRKNHAVDLVRTLGNAAEFFISSSSLDELMDVLKLLDYPLDTELHEKLSMYFMQLKSLMEISSILEIEPQQTTVNLKKESKIFHKKLKKKILPILAADLQNERQEICIILQSAYRAITQSLIDFCHSTFLPENLLQEKSRHKAIEMCCKAEELLEILEPETSSSLQVTVYERLCDCPGYELTLTDLLGDVGQLKSLEDQHKLVELSLQKMEHQYISCGNHSASSISKNLREYLNEVKCSLITCSELVQGMDKELNTFFNQAIVTYEEEQICRGLDMESLPEKLNKINTFLDSLHERHNGKDFLTVGGGGLLEEMDYVSELVPNNGNLGIQQKAIIQKDMGNLETFLESIQQENLKTDILNDLFTTSMQSILLERLTELKKIVTILTDMKQSLSSYNCQSDQETFLENVSLNDCLLLSLIGDGEISPRSTDYIKGKTIQSNSQVAYLSLAKEIVKFSNPENIRVELISEKVLQIAGNFVKFSDFVYNVASVRKEDLKEIHVFATQRIFADEDFCDDLGRELEITLISPSIEIIGCRVINLAGKPGGNHFCSSAIVLEFGRDGGTGLPGKTGGNGGHFNSICEQLISASSLTVNVRGGNGGDGQNGGDGCPGLPGRSAVASDLSGEQTEKEGAPGTSGGNGGGGGRGGYPGHGGSVKVVVLEKQDGCVNVVKEGGERGRDGRGGAGGMGGKNGNGIQKVKGWIWFVSDEKPMICNTRAPSGRAGRDGANSTNMVLPPPKNCKPDSKESVISELRKFYMNQSDNGMVSVTRRFLEKIDLKLEFQHVSVQSLAQELLQLELTSRNLQNPDSMIRDHEAFQNRLYRCVPLAFSADQLSQNEDIKHVIRLLYAQSISKVLVLKEHHDQGAGASGAQVINILGYFDIIKDTINRLKETNTEVNRREALKTYHDYLKAKCDDTKDFISRFVLPSIAQAKRDIQEEINSCAGEVESYGRIVEEDLRSRYNATRALSNIQFWEIIKTSLHALEFGIGIAQSIKYTQFGAKALSGIINIKELMEMNDGEIRENPMQQNIAVFQRLLGIDYDTPENFEQQNVQLPVCLNDFHGTMEHKMKRMSKEWELVNRFLEAHGDSHVGGSRMIRIKPSLEAWQDHLRKFQLVLNLMRQQKIALGEELEKVMAEMEKHKAEIINFLQELLEMKSANDINSSSELIDTIKHLLVDMALTNSDSTGTNSNANRQICTFEPIAVAQHQLQSVQAKYGAIFKEIMPLMNAVFETTTPSQPQESTSSSRKFQKGRIQTTLRKLKENLASFFNGLESNKSLMQAVQQMEEGFSLLIDLYDMMDSYEESKLLSSALAGIKLNTVNGEDSVELQETVNKIEYLLKANTFILDYNQAVHAFKQWIFPFANRCHTPNLNFETDFTNDHGNCENHLEKLAAEYKSHFDTIHGYLLRYRSMKMDFDDVVFQGTFSSKSLACPPFYVWKDEESGDVIKRILKGEEVELRADLMKAEEIITRKMGAVKFKTVQLKIKHKNGIKATRKQEEELNKIMKLFKVTMVHSGISYYKVFDQYFVMRGSKNEYCYSYDGATKNSTYEKSESQGDYLLSPFTIWKFQLNEVLKGGFEKLSKFEEQVDLELWGDGLYLDEGKAKEKRLDEKYLKDLHVHYELV